MTEIPPRVSSGTQVVLLREVKGSSSRPLHPRGVVGIVVRTPVGDETLYQIRLPDGFETAATRTEFDVLKHFKDRLPTPEGGGRFDLEELILLRCVVGSRAYGLDTDDSDTDLRGVYLAPADMHWSLYGAPEQFEDGVGQTCYWELQKFLTMALKANPNVLECLYSPLVEKCSSLGGGLLEIRDRFLSQLVFQTFNGYALSQFRKLEQDLRNQGAVRWKHAMHLLRLLVTGAETLRTGFVAVRVEHNRDRLLAVRHGALSWAEVDRWRQELHREFEQALIDTRLPERPDYETVNRFLIAARRAAAVSTNPCA